MPERTGELFNLTWADTTQADHEDPARALEDLTHNVCAAEAAARAILGTAEGAELEALDGKQAFAALTLEVAHNLRVYTAAARWRHAVAAAVNLGYLAGVLGVLPRERDAAIGRKVRDGGATTRRVRGRAGKLARHNVELFERLAEELRRNHPKWGVSAIRDGVAELVRKRNDKIPCSRRTLERLKIPAD